MRINIPVDLTHITCPHCTQEYIVLYLKGGGEFWEQERVDYCPYCGKSPNCITITNQESFTVGATFDIEQRKGTDASRKISRQEAWQIARDTMEKAEQARRDFVEREARENDQI